VDQGAAVGVGTVRGEVEAGREQRKRMKRGSLSAGRSPYSCTRRWLRWQKWWAAITVGGEVAAVVSWAWVRRQCLLSEEVGMVRTRLGHGSDQVANGWAPHAVPCSKNSHILHAYRQGHYKQFSLLCLYPILNEIRVKIPGIDSPFESLMNF
jgi:hypothetical protein